MGNSPSRRRSINSNATTSSGPRPIVGRNSVTTQMIPDEFTSLDQVTRSLRQHGLESCNLILGVDFTKSNEWSGKRTFQGRSLHTLEVSRSNPYEDVMTSIGQTLKDFDEDNCIPVYGFGDSVTSDHSVFTFAASNQTMGFPIESIRQRYRELVPTITMAGPTSFAPIIHQAISIVNQTGQYHILVIIADGQVTRSVDIPAHAVSRQEKETIDAIILASSYPLSIVMVGVGDGPWNAMEFFDNYLINRRFDNFQFVEFHKITNQIINSSQQLTQFALHALMEIPRQYQIIKEMGLLQKGPNGFGPTTPSVMVFPPPQVVSSYIPPPPPPQSSIPSIVPPPSLGTSGHRPSAPDMNIRPPPIQRQPSRAEVDLERLQDALVCSICEDHLKDIVFQCGHETCEQCASVLSECPTCRQAIQIRIKRYGIKD